MSNAPPLRLLPAFLSATLALALAPACARTPPPSAAADSGIASPPASTSPPPAAETAQPDEEVHPVYPLDKGPADPLAVRLCAALHDAPAKRTAACCGTKPGIVPTTECERNVSAALRLGGITLAAADVDKCAAAVDASLAGCGWVSTFAPPPPAACEGIFHGTLQPGQPCRSTLECSTGLHCGGAGPTQQGTCAPTSPDGAACSRSVDVLATFGRQDDLEAAHRTCTGYCRLGKCAAMVAVGGKCLTSVECADGAKCASGVCAIVKPGKRGEPCPAGMCETGLVCRDGACADRKAEGEECTMPWDCRGTCVRAPGAAKGTCGAPCAK